MASGVISNRLVELADVLEGQFRELVGGIRRERREYYLFWLSRCLNILAEAWRVYCSSDDLSRENFEKMALLIEKFRIEANAMMASMASEVRANSN